MTRSSPTALSSSQTEFLRTHSKDETSFQALLAWAEDLAEKAERVDTIDKLLERTPCMFYRVRSLPNDSTHFEYISPNCVQFNGVSAEAVIANSDILTEQLHPDDAAGYFAVATKARKHKTPIQWEGRVIVNGEERWRRLESHPEPQPDGSILWYGIQIDPTPHRKAEQALHKKQLEMQTILENMLYTCAIMHSVRDESGAIIDFEISYINRFGETDFKIPREQLIGQRVCDVFPINRTNGHFEQFVQVVETGQTISQEYQLLDENGIPNWYYHQIIPFDQGIAIFTNNITERKLMELALRESEAQHRAITEAVSDYAFCGRVQPDGRLTLEWATGSFYETTGYTAQEMANLPDYHFIYREDVAILQADVQRVVEGETTHTEYRVITKNGDIRWVQAHRVPMWDAVNQRVSHYYGIVSDITERKQAQDEKHRHEFLELAYAKEHELGKLKSQMMTRISHEFRTPLSGIMLACDMLEQYTDRMSDEQRSTRFAQIRMQIQHITAILDDMNFILKVRANTFLTEQVLCDVDGLIQQTLQRTRERFGDQPAIQYGWMAEMQQVYADPTLMTYILNNLLSNAMKHAPRHSIVTLEVDTRGDDLIVRVSDQGSGIRFEDQAQIFEPFFRYENKQETPGLGLGLTIVRDAIELQGGSIAIDSEPGRGTTFIVRIPQPVLA